MKQNHMLKKSSFKYYIRHDDNDEIMPLCMELPETIGYAKYFNSNKIKSFKVSMKTVKKHTKKWETNSSLLPKTFDSDSVYGDIDKYMKTKIKSFGDKLNTNFQGKKYQKKTYTNVCD